MQDPRDQRVGIEVQIRQDGGRRYRMGNEGLAGEALLSLVGGGAELGRLLDARNLLRRQVLTDCGQKLFESGVRLPPGSSPRSEDA